MLALTACYPVPFFVLQTSRLEGGERLSLCPTFSPAGVATERRDPAVGPSASSCCLGHSVNVPGPGSNSHPDGRMRQNLGEMEKAKTLVASDRRAEMSVCMKISLFPKVAEMERWIDFIEKVSVLQWVLTFLFMGVCCTLLTVYLLFTSLWLLPTIYLIWMALDWDTPERGGRQVDWVRNWAVWRHFKNYFPVKLVKTTELSPSKNYILGSHPHGIMCVGAFSCFSTGYGGFSEAFPKLRVNLATLAGLFKLPIFRDYLMSAGMCPVSKSSLEHLLSRRGKGNAVVIVTGGAAESLDSTPGVNIVVMKQRKGFVRLALEVGADLVPVYSFGETELFKQVVFSEGSIARGLQTTFKKLTGFAPCLFMGQTWGLVPYKTAITTVVGSPISVPQQHSPSEEMVDHYHGLYMEALTKLFHKNKVSCGLSESHDLHII